MLQDYLVILPSEGRGKGVFTLSDIPEETIIEISPVIVMNDRDKAHLDQTLLHDYIFEWGHGRQQCCMALGYVPIYNHAYLANCTYDMDLEHDMITIRTVRDISSGEELFINYNGEWNDPKPLWFEVS